MAGVTSYESATNMRVVVGLASGDSTKDAILQSLLDAVTHTIDLYCHRRFTSITEARTYDAPASAEMFVEDIITLTSITQDGVALVSGTDYETRPFAITRLNNTITSVVRMTAARPNGRPKAWAGRGQMSTCSINANWGFVDEALGALPYPIVEACQIMTARLYQRRTGHYENERGEAAGGLGLVQEPKASLDQDCKDLLKPFVRCVPNFSKPAWRSQ